MQHGIRAAQAGMVINAALAGIKLTAGILGNTYALVADAVESASDVFSSIIVWGGLAVAAQPADEQHPYGYGKAEAIAAAAMPRSGSSGFAPSRSSTSGRRDSIIASPSTCRPTAGCRSRMPTSSAAA